MEKEFIKDCGGIKMNTGATELVFILDKSGSMAGMEEDTIGGFNAMLKKQRELDGKVYVTTVFFSNNSTLIHDRKLIQDIEPLTKRDYVVGGCTALLDTIGKTIVHIEKIHKYARSEDVPEKTLFVITTDGLENASIDYSSNQIKQMIKNKEEKCGWEFLFLASNINAVEVAEGIGISEQRAVNYQVKEQTMEMYDTLGDAVHQYVKFGAMPFSATEFEEEIDKKTKNK